MTLKIRRNFKYYFKSIILFFFLYEVVPIGISTRFSSRKWMFLALVLAWQYGKAVRKKSLHLLRSKMVAQLLVSEIIVTVASAFWIAWRLTVHHLEGSRLAGANAIYFIFFGIFAAIFLVYMFIDMEEFLSNLITVSLWQTIFLFIEATSARLRIFLLLYIYNETSIQYGQIERVSRIPGLGAVGAVLSVTLFFGVFAAGYFIVTAKRTGKYWIYLMVILMGQFVAAKTGLFMSVFYVFYIFYIKSNKLRRYTARMVKYIAVAVCALLLFIAIFRLLGKGFVYEVIIGSFYRVFSPRAYITTNHKGGFFGAFLNMKIPPLTFDMLLGYGHSRGELGNGLDVHHDSGYVNRYVADGLFMASVEYLALFLLLKAVFSKVEQGLLKTYIAPLISLLFIIEMKEGFVYQYIYVALILAVFLFATIQDMKVAPYNYKGRAFAPFKMYETVMTKNIS